MIFGITLSHNSTFCALDNEGYIQYCASEERFSRVKNDCGLPLQSIDSYYKHHHLNIDPKFICIGDSCHGKYSSKKFGEFLFISNRKIKDNILKNPFKLFFLLTCESISKILKKQKNNYQSLIIEKLQKKFPKSKILFFNHHHCHAASAYYTSPFKEALIFTLDGSGDNLSGTLSLGKNGTLNIFKTMPETSSVGAYYKSITSFLGFTPGRHEGKVVGLAAMGDSSTYYSQFSKLLFIKNNTDGSPRISSIIGESLTQNYSLTSLNFLSLIKNHFIDYLKARKKGWDEFRKLSLRRKIDSIYNNKLGLPLKTYNINEKANLAASAQAVLEDVVLEYISYYIDQHQIKNLCLAGGVFANVKLNQRILEETNIENIYVHPGMGDEGLAIGAAKLYFHGQKNSPSVFLDNVFTAHHKLENTGDLKKFHLFNNDELIDKIIKNLEEGKVIGLFRASAEYGPRALGHRSIIANPSDQSINTILNNKLNRTDFMPFAPIVTDNLYEDVFTSNKIEGSKNAAKFMTITLKVNNKWNSIIPAVIHQDQTARPQIITKESDSFLHTVLTGFYHKTGIPALINTSFNAHEEPIVHSSQDALKVFNNKAIDILIIDNYWCEHDE